MHRRIDLLELRSLRVEMSNWMILEKEILILSFLELKPMVVPIVYMSACSPMAILQQVLIEMVTGSMEDIHCKMLVGQEPLM